MKTRFLLTGVPAIAVALAACSDVGTEPGTPQFNHEAARQSAVTPTTVLGNFVAADDVQLCYLAAPTATGDLRGFKIDDGGPSGTYVDADGAGIDIMITNDGVNPTTAAGGKYLFWNTLNAPNTKVIAVVMKGGNGYNLYQYFGAYTADAWLHSPLLVNKGKSAIAGLSHTNFCYEEEGGTQGCTPGYWRNHADRWTGVSPSDDFDLVFGVDLFSPDITLGTAIWASGGGNDALARHATAALLNALGGVPNADGTTVDYPFTAAEVIQMVQDAVANGTIEETKDVLADANELGCPLSGTRAVDVVP